MKQPQRIREGYTTITEHTWWCHHQKLREWEARGWTQNASPAIPTPASVNQTDICWVQTWLHIVSWENSAALLICIAGKGFTTSHLSSCLKGCQPPILFAINYPMCVSPLIHTYMCTAEWWPWGIFWWGYLGTSPSAPVSSTRILAWGHWRELTQ